jgi:hypothetical protein
MNPIWDFWFENKSSGKPDAKSETEHSCDKELQSGVNPTIMSYRQYCKFYNAANSVPRF